MNNESGLTFVEVLVASFISVIAGGLLLVIMANSTGIFYRESSKIDQGLRINDVLMILRKEIKGASSIAISYTDGPTTYTSGANQLILKVPSLDTQGNLISETFDHFVFFRDQNKFHMKIFPNPLSQRKPVDRILVVSLDSVLFQYYNKAAPPVEVAPDLAAEVKTTVALVSAVGLKTERSIATSEASLRNN